MVLSPGSLHNALRAEAGGVRFVIGVKPRSSREGLEDAKDGGVTVRVQAPPEDGKANARVVAVLADALGVARGRISIARGDKARHKELVIQGLSVDEIVARLSSA